MLLEVGGWQRGKNRDRLGEKAEKLQERTKVNPVHLEVGSTGSWRYGGMGGAVLEVYIKLQS